MSAFKQLKDVSNNFEQQLRTITTELFSAKIGESFEDGITKKLQDLTVLRSKLRLLRAKPLSALPQITQLPKSEDTIKEYGEVVQWKVLEQHIIKSVTQAHAVKALITTPDTNLDPELVERKEKIIKCLKEYRVQESKLRQLDDVLKEKEDELATVRMQWDAELNQLWEMKEKNSQIDGCTASGPLYDKLRSVVDKLELMRWLVSRLMMSRGSRDWLATPDRTAQLFRLARKHNTVESFLES